MGWGWIRKAVAVGALIFGVADAACSACGAPPSVGLVVGCIAVAVVAVAVAVYVTGKYFGCW
ncbi:hypothetical protein M3Y99_01580000 [Aphelenchoides fujianensis]|nr:hypothetical protein M3Y99_01580000 [Aphelenchoides fujianensis]